MQFGKLNFTPVEEALELIGVPVRTYIETNGLAKALWAAEIDPTLADTAAFCEHYGIGPEVSANCVIVEAKRADRVWYAACIVLATTRADVNNVVRRHLNARKISFAPMDTATSLTAMEYGGITPIGLPADWPILIDEQVMQHRQVVIGSGIRGSKVLATTNFLASLSSTEILDITKTVRD
jgi:prolyl-tRNA editing enzyme YbaK/EbsC (Cys-tRNA(Pro) deacylase)